MGDIAWRMSRHISSKEANILNNPDPTGEPCPVYFDLYGRFMVVYSFAVSNFVNTGACLLAVLLFFLTAPASSASKRKTSAFWKRCFALVFEIIKCSVPVFLSFIFGMMTAVFTSLLVGVVLGSPLTWYAQPSFALILYGIPTWLGAMVVQSIVWFFASDEKGTTQHPQQPTLYTLQHYAPPHYTLHTIHYTLHTTHYTSPQQYTLPYYTLHTSHYTPHLSATVHTTHHYTTTKLMTLIPIPSLSRIGDL